MEFMLDNWMVLAGGVLAVLSGLYAVGRLVAPKTDSELDDKVVGILGQCVKGLKVLLGKK